MGIHVHTKAIYVQTSITWADFKSVEKILETEQNDS